jgi:hypothetical protein
MVHRRAFNRALITGLVFLIVASVVRLLLEHHSTISDGPRDLIVGLCYGVAIGCLILGLRRGRRSSSQQ